MNSFKTVVTDLGNLFDKQDEAKKAIDEIEAKIAKVNKKGFATQSLFLFLQIFFINIFFHNSESCQQYSNTYQQHYPPYLHKTGN